MKPKHLTTLGDSLALILDRSLLEVTQIGPETPLEVTTDGNVIVITPVRDAARTGKLRQGVKRMDERYASVFRRLTE